MVWKNWEMCEGTASGRKNDVQRDHLWEGELQGMPREWKVGASTTALSPLPSPIFPDCSEPGWQGEPTEPIGASYGSWEVGG